jgi:hypothetical protein
LKHVNSSNFPDEIFAQAELGVGTGAAGGAAPRMRRQGAKASKKT